MQAPTPANADKDTSEAVPQRGGSFRLNGANKYANVAINATIVQPKGIISLKQSPKLARDTLVNQYLEAARARDFILVPVLPGRPTELIPYDPNLNPNTQSFLYQLVYGDKLFGVGDKIAAYDGTLESPNILHSYDLTDRSN